MNWAQIIDEIKTAGMTQKEIADVIDVSVGTLSEMKNGKVCEPRWSKGERLLLLHHSLRRKIKRAA